MNQNNTFTMRRNKNIRMMPNIFCLGYLLILFIVELWQYINKLINYFSKSGSASERKASWAGPLFIAGVVIQGMKIKKTEPCRI